MTTPNDQAQFSNVSATPAVFVLVGGQYGITCSATFGGGSATLQVLSLDGSTWISVLPAFTSSGFANIDLPPGQYRVLIATATAVYFTVSKIRRM